MKVVLFCGGYGMRMRDNGYGMQRRDADGEGMPKPMQMVGSRPLLWHVMRYYAHYGHTEFILCLGYGAWHIKEYFLSYNETVSNDFTLRGGSIELMSSDISDWTINFVDTGLTSAIGERLRLVRKNLGDDQFFLANYSDVLTDAPLDDMIKSFHEFGGAASMMIVPPQSSFHTVEVTDAGEVKDIVASSELPVWENGGYFVLSQEIFELLPPGGDLVEDVCVQLASQGRLFGYKYTGFWKPADTFKERAELDASYHRGEHPWMVWETSEQARPEAADP